FACPDNPRYFVTVAKDLLPTRSQFVLRLEKLAVGRGDLKFEIVVRISDGARCRVAVQPSRSNAGHGPSHPRSLVGVVYLPVTSGALPGAYIFRSGRSGWPLCLRDG